MNWTPERREEARHRVIQMFDHGLDNYMNHAFPHDELKPLSKGWTDSLGDLGNVEGCNHSGSYHGTALTLVDALSTLAVMGRGAEFANGLWLLVDKLDFDQDVRVNVFEVNIRMLGGLLSCHLLAEDASLGLMQQQQLKPQRPYGGELLAKAEELGRRMLPAFDQSPTGLPYAWINLKHGVPPGDTTETNAAAAGSFTLEMGLLSRLTGDPVFEDAAVRSLAALWTMRTHLDLFGTSINVTTHQWVSSNGGTGAGADSFFEYLLKAYILFGEAKFWHMFSDAYRAVMQHMRTGAMYHDVDIFSGQPSHMQLQSLQAFWPGMQVLAGDFVMAEETFWHIFVVWQRFGLLPERYLYGVAQLHPSEQYYPLRPELMESAFYLYEASQDARFLEAGAVMVDALYNHTWTEGGFASIRSVASMKQEDHMHSFFLAEVCKYLYLLYDNTFMKKRNWVFTTEGHPLPVRAEWHEQPSPLRNFDLAQRRFQQHPHRPLTGFMHVLAQQLSSGAQQVVRVIQHVQPGGASKEPAVAASASEEVEVQQQCSLPEEMLQARPSLVEATLQGMTAAAAPAEDAEQASNALQQRICPLFWPDGVASLCHVLDHRPDHSCQSTADCGIDARECLQRTCSRYSYCS